MTSIMYVSSQLLRRMSVTTVNMWSEQESFHWKSDFFLRVVHILRRFCGRAEVSQPGQVYEVGSNRTLCNDAPRSTVGAYNSQFSSTRSRTLVHWWVRQNNQPSTVRNWRLCSLLQELLRCAPHVQIYKRDLVRTFCSAILWRFPSEISRRDYISSSTNSTKQCSLAMKWLLRLLWNVDWWWNELMKCDE